MLNAANNGHREIASISAAIDGTSRSLRTRSSIKTLKRSWSDYGSIAHLSAAYLALSSATTGIAPEQDREDFRCRVDGKPVKFTLGRYPLIKLKEAREKAKHALDLVDHGLDPRQQREEEQQENATRRANTLRVIAEKFRDRHMKRVRPRSWKDSWSALDRHVLSRLESARGSAHRVDPPTRPARHPRPSRR